MSDYKMKTVYKNYVLLVFAALVLAGGTVASGKEKKSELARRLSKMTPAEQIAHLRGLPQSGGNEAEIHFYLGNAFYAAEQADSAIAEYVKAVEADSAYSKAYVNMGIVLDAGGQVSKARWAYQQALEIKPDDVLALCHLGFNYFNSGHRDEAIDYYRKALAIDPNSAQAHYNLGIAFANAKIFKEALTEWKRVVELDPDGELGKLAAENVELLKTYINLSE
jgi:tetratricopeptide (TPR) repeat protein